MVYLPTSPTLWQRFKYFWWLKAIVTTGIIFIFFQLYFFTLHHNAFGVYNVPMTFLDQKIPFTPSLLWVYASLWIYTSLPASLLFFKDELVRYAAGMGCIAVIGLCCFYLVPTAVVFDLPQGAYSAEIAFLKKMDTSGNSCPSLHVATALFAGVWFEGILQRLSAPKMVYGLTRLWCFAIVYSTLAIKQHVLIDVIAGALLAVVFIKLMKLPTEGYLTNQNCLTRRQER